MNDKKRFSSTTLLTGTALLLGLMMTQSASAATLTEDPSFGSDPGNLTMYYYSGTNTDINIGNAGSTSPVVVAMHGCDQTAEDYVNNSGLKDLADAHAFHIVAPQQKTGFFGNHASGCFNWFQSGDATNGNGEAASIANMVVEFAKTSSGTVYASGFSAGGGMATVMLAAYPDVFSGAVVHAGLPYRCATTVVLSLPCMGMTGFLPAVDKTPSVWDGLLDDSGYSGPATLATQTLTMYHGDDDATVVPSRSTEIEEQWSLRVNASSQLNVHSIANMGHKMAVDGSAGCGGTPPAGSFAQDVNVCAQSVGLDEIGVW